MRKVLIADCHDSFVFNVVELLRNIEDCAIEVLPTEYTTTMDLSSYDGIILSPGPSTPQETEGLFPLLSRCYTTHPILGICLGHQAIAHFFGAKLQQLPSPLHGHGEQLTDIAKDELLFTHYHATKVARYHSWVVEKDALPKELCITALARSDKSIMAIRHTSLPIRGVQFHPESYLTEEGADMLRAWIQSIYGAENE